MTCPPCTHNCEQGKTCPAKSNNEIIAMARHAGFDLNMWQLSLGCEAFGTHDELIAFAKLVAAKEREACALIAETPIYGEQDDITMEAKDRVAAAIRARGQA
jgi:hypothetical protein